MPALVIDSRNTARTVPDLGMCCDAREIPDTLGGPPPRTWWVCGLAGVQGDLRWHGDGRPPLNQLTGMCAVAVSPTAFYAIVAPEDRRAPAVWLAQDLPSLRVSASGSQGLFRKRPQAIDIDGPGWGLTLGHVARVFRSSAGPRGDRMQTGQEGAFLEAMLGRG